LRRQDHILYTVPHATHVKINYPVQTRQIKAKKASRFGRLSWKIRHPSYCIKTLLLHIFPKSHIKISMSRPGRLWLPPSFVTSGSASASSFRSFDTTFQEVAPGAAECLRTGESDKLNG